MWPCPGMSRVIRTAGTRRAGGLSIACSLLHVRPSLTDAELDWALPHGELYGFPSRAGVFAASPVMCAPWCEDGDGHANAVFREDQTCWGPATYVDLSLEPTQDEAGAYLPRFGAQAYRWWPGAAPCVYFHIDGIKVPANRGGDCPLDDSVHLTADEAIRLATALLKAAGDIKGEPNGPASRLI